MTNIASRKSELRRQFRDERAARFSKFSESGTKSSSDFMHLMGAPEIVSATYVTSYISMRDEPSTTHLNLALIAAGKILLLPRVNHPNLEWVPWAGNAAKLDENRGLLEPIGKPITELSLIDAVIVPALQIDTDGYRIGQGGGYYDRSLPRMSGWKVGIVYAEEFTSDPLPREDHDFPLVAVATPDELIRLE